MRVVGAMKFDDVALHLPGFRKLDLRSGPIACGLKEMPDTKLDRNNPRHRTQVIVKVRAFSCNYRDGSVIKKKIDAAPPNRLVPFGSEFCGSIVDMGAEVDKFSIGDRVFGAFTYPDSPAPGLLPGVASNQCSQELLRLPSAKLASVPHEMTDSEAAAFSLNGITVASMLRRLALKENERLLVLAGRSNVALFTIQAASALGAKVTVVTTTETIADRLLELGASRVIVLKDPASGLAGCHELASVNTLGFDAIVDPFMDVHLHQAPEVLAVNGRYVTCGTARQAPGDTVAHGVTQDWMYRHFYAHLLLKNIQLMGNCLGEPQDMVDALEKWYNGTMRPVVDSCFDSNDTRRMLHRSFVDTERLGKVVCCFE